MVLQVAFIVFLVTYLYECVNYDVLFRRALPPHHDPDDPLEKVYLSDCVVPIGKCATGFSFTTWLALLLALGMWATRALATCYHFFEYWDIKSFYNTALGITDGELDSVSWREVQAKIVSAQEEYRMCIHKSRLTELDIYHRILRFKNYLVAMVNKDMLPVRFNVPVVGEKVFLSHGLKFNLELLFFKGPWAPFNQWHLKDDYKKAGKRAELTAHLQTRIAQVALANLLLMPVIFLWQLVYSFFNHAEVIKREPGSLGVRKWSHYARLYLRHFNELDHELKERLNRAYKPANRYMELFVSPLSVVLAQNAAFVAGAPLAILIVLTVWDEDVLAVEHVLAVMTVLSFIVIASRSLIPDENLVFTPESRLTVVMAHIHYFPDTWRGRAHTHGVMGEVGELFPYTFAYMVQELVSPIVTPFILFFCLRPRAAQIVDFFKNFTVEVQGVGDICSFAQMDVRRHGNADWQPPQHPAQTTQAAALPPTPKTNQYTRAEDGKTELSLVHFSLANPGWKPPQDSEQFIAALKDQVARDTEALPTVTEEATAENVLYGSLSSLQAAGGVHSEVANSIMHSVGIGLESRPTVSPTYHQQSSASLMRSITQQLQDQNAAGRSSSILASRMMMPSMPPHQHPFSSSMGSSSSAMLAPPPAPNLGQDLRRLGLEMTAADMSLSALYLHELHHRVVLSSSRTTVRNRNVSEASRYEFEQPSNSRGAVAFSLNELDEENVPLIETGANALDSQQARLSSSGLH